MKAIVFLVVMLGLTSLPGIAQQDSIPLNNYIDQSVRDYTTSPPAILAREITEGYKSDREKVTAIFRWITENISYNVRAASRRNASAMIYEEFDDDTVRTLKPLNLRVAETVLRRKMAVCDGYARLFKTLCDNAGIPARVITGYARTGWDRRKTKFGSNHSWNAVYIDSSWHLLDATWASGYTSYRGDEFYRQYNARYFLTSPYDFIIDHYPEDARWSLLPQGAPTLSEFYQSPYRYMGFLKTGIRSFTPSKGIIEANLGDTLKFEVVSSIQFGLLEAVTGNQPEDTIWNDDEPVIITGLKKTCNYIVNENSREWLYLICNGYVILRYKLVIRRPDNKLAQISQQSSN